MQCICILCQRALYTLRKRKATQARTTSQDSKLSWPSSTSPRHANSLHLRRAHLLIWVWRRGMDSWQFIFLFLKKNKKQGSQKESWRSWTPCTRCYPNTQQLLLRKDFSKAEEQHLCTTHRPEASSPTFWLLSFTGKPWHCHHFHNPPQALQSSHHWVWSSQRSLGTILLGFSLFRWVHVTHRCGQGLSWAALRHCSNGHKQTGKIAQKTLPSFHTFKQSHEEWLLRASHYHNQMKNLCRISISLPPQARKEPLTDVRY